MVAIEKKPGVYPLRLLGILLDRHTAWVISRLENLCCLLSYSGIVLNGLTLDNLFVEPATHQIYLYGGWWFAGYQNGTMSGISADAKMHLREYLEASDAILHGLGIAASCGWHKASAGMRTREAVEGLLTLPEPFRNSCWSRQQAVPSSFAEWDRVLGPRTGNGNSFPFPSRMKSTASTAYYHGSIPR